MGMLENAIKPGKLEKGELKALAYDLRVSLVNTQLDLADADFPVIVLLAGDDRVVVDEVLHGLGEWVDERQIRAESFAPATDEERERPRFWRYWRALPEKGQIGVMVGGWAQGTCAGRVSKELNKGAFARRIAHDVSFEQTLIAHGALLLKFWFHLPKKALRKRLKEAGRSPASHWYIDERDWAMYEAHDDAVLTIDKYLERTDTFESPWQLIDSTDGAAASVVFAQTLLAAVTDRMTRGAPQRSTAPSASPQVEGRPSVLDAVNLSKVLEKKSYDRQLKKYSARLKKLAEKATDRRVSTILVFEGWDAAGKGGAIRRVKRALDPRVSRVVSIAAPTENELGYPYLWRFWQRLPRAGSTLIFDRSWYGRVLVERVEGFATHSAWSRAYGEIEDFESQLIEHGYIVRKFWLHIDPDEQLERFKAREKTAYKKYKITDEDYRNRDRWDDYVVAVDDMVRHTSTEGAPWHLVGANDKRWARIEVLKTVCEAIEERLDQIA